MQAVEGDVQSAAKVAAVLSAFTLGQSEMRVGDLAEAVGLSQSAASRLLSSMAAEGLLARSDSGMYRLGPQILVLGGAALNSSQVFRVARQIAQDLASETGLGVNLAVRLGPSIQYLTNFEGQLAPRSYSHLGMLNPLHATGLGKSLLAGLTDDQIKEILDGRLVRYTEHTITNMSDLLKVVAEVRRRGYSKEIEELALSRGCVAAPIRDLTGSVIAAISISGPLSAVALDAREVTLAQMVVEAADHISVGLGYRPAFARADMAASDDLRDDQMVPL
jgi:DNA-binding IclR family transcriptional regulator